MELNEKDLRHFLKTASDFNEAFCCGRYIGVAIEKVLVNVPISGCSFNETKTKTFTLVRVLFSNQWKHRINVWTDKMKLIDSEGIQHSHELGLDIFIQETKIKVSARREVRYNFKLVDDGALEGNAKIRGWLWFPALPKKIYPSRLIFRFDVFKAGDTSGWIEDSETLEVAFEFKFQQLLPTAKPFVTLETNPEF